MRKVLAIIATSLLLSACTLVFPSTHVDFEDTDEKVYFQSLSDRSAIFHSHASELQEKADDLKKPLVGTGIVYGRLTPIVAEVYSLLAQDAGIRKGDELLAIDGVPVYSGMEAARITTGNDLSKVGTSVRLTIRTQRRFPFNLESSEEAEFRVRRILLRTVPAREIAEFEDDLRKFESRLSQFDAMIQMKDALYPADPQKYRRDMQIFKKELRDFENYLAQRIESIEENGYHRARYIKVSSSLPFLPVEP